MDSPQPAPPDTADRNLLFGILALQTEFIDQAQFIDACAAWAARKEGKLAELLVQRQWISAEDCRQIEGLMQRKLERHTGNAGDSLRGIQALPAKQALQQASLQLPFIKNLVGDLNLGDLDPGLPDDVDEDPRRRYEFMEHQPRMGGMGQVWRVRDKQLGRVLALKELKQQFRMDSLVRDGFFREAQVNAQLTHPNIVPLYDFVRNPGTPAFCTMQFIEGRTLTSAVEEYHAQRRQGQESPVDFRALLSAFVSVCQALGYAHDQGVLHRDVKGTNVVVGSHGEVFLVDWGLAKVRNDREQAINLATSPTGMETRHGDRIGTPAYMAPEQAAGALHQINERTDIYGLGAILYEILAGQPPFPVAVPEGSSQAEWKQHLDALYERIQRDEPTPPRHLNPLAPPALEAVCLKALRKAPSERYPSAQALAQEITHWLAGEPVTAYPEPWHVRATRWSNRNKPWVTAAALFLVSATTLAVLWSTERDRHLLEVEQAKLKREQLRTKSALQDARASALAAQSAESAAHQNAKLISAQRDLALETIRTVDELDKVEGYFRKSLEIAEAQAEAEPGNPFLQRNLSGSYANMGEFMLRGAGPKEARPFFEKSLHIDQKLASDAKENADAQRELALANRKMGDISLKLGQFSAAQSYFDNAVAISRHLARNDEKNQAALRDLCQAYGQAGDVNLFLGQLDRAEMCFKSMQTHARDLAQARPKNLQTQVDLIECQKKLAAVYFEMLDFARARAALKDAVAVSQHLARVRNLTGTPYALWSKFLAEEYEELKDTEQLVMNGKDLHEQSSERQRIVLDALVRRHVKNNEATQALQTADRLAQLKPQDRRTHFQTARAYALILKSLPASSTLREATTTKALSALRQAIIQGYADVDLLRHHAYFDALQTVPAFQALIKGLEK